MVTAQVALPWRERAAFAAAVVALLCLLLARWLLAFPAGQLGVNWSVTTADFGRLRAQWNAAQGDGLRVNLAALAAVLAAILLVPKAGRRLRYTS